MIKKIGVGDIELGMYVVQLDRSWLETPFLFHRQKISSPAIIAKFHKYGIRHVFIDTDQGKDITQKPVNSGHQPEKPPDNPVPQLLDEKLPEEPPVNDPAEVPIPSEEQFLEDLYHAEQVRDKAITVSRDLLLKVAANKAMNFQDVTELSAQIADCVLSNMDALLSLTRMKSLEEYTNIHSVNVSIISAVVGRVSGMKRAELVNLAMAGLLHDVGKMKIPPEILHKPASLTEDEFVLMKKHPALGHEFLRTNHSLPEEVLKGVVQHHERADGSGYPLGLKQSEISIHGLICGMADAYDAITSNKVYGRGQIMFSGLRELYSAGAAKFSDKLIGKLVKVFGLYPVGSLVKLSNGKLAVVWKPNRQNLIRPTVELKYDINKQCNIRPLRLDLSSQKYAEIKIESVEQPSAWGVSI